MAEKRVPFSKDWGANLVVTEAWTDNDKILVESKQDVTAIFEQNKFEKREGAIMWNSKFRYNNGFRKVATIPNIIIDRLMTELAPSGKMKWHDKKYMKKWLNDPVNKAWRCSGDIV